jgi:SAD/SRA domain
MQKGYVHAIMKLPASQVDSGKRMAIVFRNGKEVHIDHDNGYLLSNIDAPERLTNHAFGPMTDTLIEGQLYSREYLFRSGAHFNERGGVSGNKNQGCPSIVVTRVAPELGEFDAFLYFSYYAEPRQRSGALLTSYDMKLPVRVFRSSKGINGQFHPSAEFRQRVYYRYDGIYYIICVKQRNGNDASQQIGQRIGNVFYLFRAEPHSEMLQLQTQHPNFQPFHPQFERCFNIQRASDICQSQFNPMHYKNWLDQPLQLSEMKLPSHEV